MTRRPWPTGVPAPTALLDPADLAAARDLMDAAFDDFTDHDWQHGLGGFHALVHDDGVLVAHGSLVLRRLYVEGRALRCGYVEAVAVHPAHRRRGLGSSVMGCLEGLAGGYDLLALSSSSAGEALYEARGWTRWRGPTSVVGPEGLQRTPEDDGGVMVLGGHGLDLDAPLACDHRDGDPW